MCLFDADDEEIKKAKSNLYIQDDKGVWSANKEVIHRMMSNNSIVYYERPTFEELKERFETIRYSSEGNFFNLESALKRNPNTSGTNPCFTGRMQLLTKDGYKSFKELDGKEVDIIGIDGYASKGKVWKSGKKTIIRLNTGRNFPFFRPLHCTPDHVLMLSDGTECKAIDSLGKKLKLYIKPARQKIEFVKLGMLQECVDLTQLDYKRDLPLNIKLSYKRDNHEIINYLQPSQQASKTYCIHGYNKQFYQYDFDLAPFKVRKEPKGYHKLSKRQKASFLCGCFCVNAEVIEKNRIMYYYKSFDFAKFLQKTLKQDFGISSSITETIDRLQITGMDSIMKFYEEIGFEIPRKKQDLEDLVKYFSPKIEELTLTLNPVDVYDFNEPKKNWGIVNGYVVHNCGEILLDSNQFCNLTTINTMGFVKDGKLDKQGLLNAQRLSARAGYRNATVEIELPNWNIAQQRDMLIGCSVTGWQDMINATKLSIEEEKQLLSEMKEVAQKESKLYAEELNLNPPLLTTSVKPEGCLASCHCRTTDKGILLMDEINPFIDSKLGFVDYNDNNTVRGNRITKTFKSDSLELVEIRTVNDRILKMTPSHPLSVNGKWVEARNLELGSVLDYKLGCYTNEKDFVFNYNCQMIINKQKTPDTMSEDLAWLLGVYFAKYPCIITGNLRYEHKNYNVQLKAKGIWKRLFNIDNKIQRCKRKRLYYQEFDSSNVCDWLIANNLDTCADRIPVAIRCSSYNTILAFIMGYVDGLEQNNFYKKSFAIISENEELMRHFQEVGEAIGISFNLYCEKIQKSIFERQTIYTLFMSRFYSDDTNNLYKRINELSIMAEKSPIVKGNPTTKNPFTVIDKILIDEQFSYDIEVEDEHWYYQGAIKSHNTISLLPTVSSGVHFSHAPYYIRRIRINATDPLAKVCEELGYPMHPENGQTLENCTTKVIEFPVKAPDGKTKYDVSAIEQLEIYKMFMENYVEHNASNTISVRENEWDDVIKWVYDNWNTIVGVTFMQLNDSYYQLLPYEAITKEEYEKRIKDMKPFLPSLISKYEVEEMELDIGESDCVGGSCPLR